LVFEVSTALLEQPAAGSKTGTLFWESHQVRSGMNQGDHLSPIVFNVAVDTVVRHIRASFPPGTFWGLFYTYDGWLVSHNPTILQEALNLATDPFQQLACI
jgi:hypothetical protein